MGRLSIARRTFPLELDLPEPCELISREVPGQPFRLGFVDRPPLGHDRRACLAAQGKARLVSSLMVS